MALPFRRRDAGASEPELEPNRELQGPPAGERPETDVSAHATSPDRTVFTESGNSDGWIATDLTVELER